jgi:hypothetical protein
MKRDRQVKILDELLALVAQHPQEQAIVNEHLQSARTYLLGGMPDEYAANLRLARSALPQIQDEPLRERAASLLDSLNGDRT